MIEITKIKSKLAKDIILYPDLILQQICEEIDINNEDDLKLAENIASDLINTIKVTSNIAGLAAPQIGYNKRIFAYKIGSLNIVCVNPEITTLPGITTKILSTESCLSIPNYSNTISRYDNIMLKSYSLKSESVYNIQLKDKHAIVVQHEIDHLNGILINDYKEKNQ